MTRLLRCRNSIGDDPERPRPTTIHRGGSSYPELLDAAADPPELLHVRGCLPAHPCVAVVGSRACSAYGRRVATGLAMDLARAGLTVVSGLARGIDAAAHRGCLEAGGRTVAVLPGGLYPVYPRRHRTLARRIASSGALVANTRPGRQSAAGTSRSATGSSPACHGRPWWSRRQPVAEHGSRPDWRSSTGERCWSCQAPSPPPPRPAATHCSPTAPTHAPAWRTCSIIYRRRFLPS